MTLFQITYQHIQEGSGSQLQPCPFLSVACDQSCPGPLTLHEFYCDARAWRKSKNLLVKWKGSRM